MELITKTPAEKFPVYFNFSRDLAVGETIERYILTCVNKALGTGDIFQITLAGSTINVDRTADEITLSPGGTVTGFLAKTLSEIREELEDLGATVGDYENLGDNNYGDAIADSGGAQASPYMLTVIDGLDVLVDSDSIVSGEVQVVVEAGTEGDLYQLTCVGTTTNGNEYERDLLVNVLTIVTDDFIKQPGASFMFSVDFERRIPEGDSLSGSDATGIKESDGTDVSGSIVLTTSIVETKIGVPVTGGEDEETFRIGVLGTTAAGYVFEKTVRMMVQEF